jgi:hypothetical protein
MAVDTDAVGARQALLLMAQVLLNIAQSGDVQKMVATCDSLALAFSSNPDWTLPAEIFAAKRDGLN